MEKILMLVNTYFQLMVAIDLKMTEFKDKNVDIIITDKTVNSEEIVKNVQKTKLFNKVYRAQIMQLYDEKSSINKIIQLMYLNKENNIKQSIEMTDFKYDIFLFYNFNEFSYVLYNKLKSENENIIAKRFEEGYGSYLYKDKKLKGDKLRKILRRISIQNNLENNIAEYYFFNPELIIYNEKAKLKKISNLNKKNEELIKYCNSVFDYNKLNDEYLKKYIFFEESFFCDGYKINDLELVLKIAEIVGKENLLVKLHPRNKIDRFKKYGINTNKTIGVPWEVIQMNNDFSDKVFFTISSGSVLASKLYFNENIKTYLLFNCTDKMSNMVTDKYFQYMKKIKSKFGIEDFIIPKNKKEFLERLKNE